MATPVMAPSMAAAPSLEGYTITITVTPSGFRVSEAQPIMGEEMGEDMGEGMGEEMGEEMLMPTAGEMLKHVLAVVKSNPLGAGEDEQVEAGYTKRGMGSL